jgi:hypothetical protein
MLERAQQFGKAGARQSNFSVSHQDTIITFPVTFSRRYATTDPYRNATFCQKKPQIVTAKTKDTS